MFTMLTNNFSLKSKVPLEHPNHSYGPLTFTDPNSSSPGVYLTQYIFRITFKDVPTSLPTNACLYSSS